MGHILLEGLWVFQIMMALSAPLPHAPTGVYTPQEDWQRENQLFSS